MSIVSMNIGWGGKIGFGRCDYGLSEGDSRWCDRLGAINRSRLGDLFLETVE